jgi:hypothetical protein
MAELLLIQMFFADSSTPLEETKNAIITWL